MRNRERNTLVPSFQGYSRGFSVLVSGLVIRLSVLHSDSDSNPETHHQAPKQNLNKENLGHPSPPLARAFLSMKMRSRRRVLRKRSARAWVATIAYEHPREPELAEREP